MLHIAVHEVQSVVSLAHIVHQAHTVCSQLIHICNMLLPKHMLGNSPRCLDNDICSLQTCIRHTAKLRASNSVGLRMTSTHQMPSAECKCERDSSIFAVSLTASRQEGSQQPACVPILRSL